MLTLTAVAAPRKSSRFDLGKLVEERAGDKMRDGDILVVSSKFMAISEGRVIDLRTVRPSSEAIKLASAYQMDPRLCELVLRESDTILGGIPGFILATRDGLLAPNAGIDKSNISHGKVVLYPRKPEASARRLRRALKFALGISVAVVVCDSRLSPTRRGTTGVAVAASGIEAVLDMRGRSDLFGNVLKVTSQAVADDVSSAAELLMGESDEATPIVIVRGFGKNLQREQEYRGLGLAIPLDEDVFLRSLGRNNCAYA